VTRLRYSLAASLLCSLFAWGAQAQPEDPDDAPDDTVPPSEDAPEEQPPEDAPPDDSAEVVEEEGAPADRAPPNGKGAVWGVVSESERSEPLIEVQVTVAGKKIETFTDIDGRYRFELAPGTYDLELWMEGYEPIVLRGITVRAGEVVRVDEKLAPQKGGVDVIEVEEEVSSSSVEGQNLERKRSAAVGDAVGRTEIQKTPDKTAAEAAKRVVGTNIVDGRFVYVRGLGERYTNSLLDGAPLPSPEPDRQTVPLDLFPALMLENLTVVKTFTPDSPGDFAGGSVRIFLRRLPDKPTFSVSGSIGFNSQSTFRDGLSYEGGDLDWLGFDDGGRELPSEIPDSKVCLGCPNEDGGTFGNEAITGYGRALNRRMSTKRATVPPDHTFNVVAGNSWSLGGDQRIGVMGAVTYNRSFEQREDEILRTFGLAADGLTRQNDLLIDRGIDRVSWGTLAGVTYQPHKHHRIHLTGLYSRASDKQAVEIQGSHEERQGLVPETRLEFVTRSLVFGQLRFEHDLPSLNDAALSWNVSLARGERNQPDTRAVVYKRDTAFGHVFEDDSQSGLHFFAEQGETTVGGGLDWDQPLDDEREHRTRLKFGSSFSVRSRAFEARRFRFRPNTDDPSTLVCAVDVWDPACPDQLFRDENIGSVLQLEENSRSNDAYDASLNVFAGYIQGEARLTDDLRIIAGPRLEVSNQSVSSFDPFDPNLGRIEGNHENYDLLPGVALVYAVTRSTNLRVAGSRTLARPQLRELAPFTYTDYFGGRDIQGNPELELTHIYNVDARFEWFPTLREVLALSVFYKHFQDPIEAVVTAGGARGKITYENADRANLFGVEAEVRKSFDFITPVLADLSFIANVTLSRSQIDLDPENVAVVTNPSRPLAHQAPYVLNLALAYENDDTGTGARILYNIAGPNVVNVGTKGLPDVYEQPRHLLDITASQEIVEGLEVKASGKNLINAAVRRTVGSDDDDEFVTEEYRTGVGVSLGLGYTY
jgi:outer membrane receptor for ferrienterochelin and colicin